MISVSVSLVDVNPVRLELGAKLEVVLDDAVVHDRDRAGDVRVRVDLRGPAVGRPARVPDADRASRSLSRERLLEVSQLAHRADDLDAVRFVDG